MRVRVRLNPNFLQLCSCMLAGVASHQFMMGTESSATTATTSLGCACASICTSCPPVLWPTNTYGPGSSSSRIMVMASLARRSVVRGSRLPCTTLSRCTLAWSGKKARTCGKKARTRRAAAIPLAVTLRPCRLHDVQAHQRTLR